MGELAKLLSASTGLNGTFPRMIKYLSLDTPARDATGRAVSTGVESLSCGGREGSFHAWGGGEARRAQ